MKKLFSAILLIFCCNFMIVNVHATYKDDYLKLMPKVVEILDEKGVYCPYRLLEDGETYGLLTVNNKKFLTVIRQHIEPRNGYTREFISNILYEIHIYKNKPEDFKKIENKEEYYEKAVKILKVIHDIKWNEKAD